MIRFLKFLLRPLKPILYPVYRKFYLDPRRFKSFSEGDLIELFFRNRKQGVMVDVGAHYGESFAYYAETGWSIHAFEPDRLNRTKIPPLSTNVHLSEQAVSDQDGLTLDFFQSTESTGISGLVRFHDTHASSYQVETVTLRTYLKSHQIGDVSFLKIDTEGNDLLVLKGFPFERLQADLILCEFEDEKTQHLNYNYTDMGQFLLDQGYQVYLSEWYPIEKYGVEHNWRKIVPFQPGEKLEDEKGWGNFIAVKTDLNDRFNKILSRYLSKLTK